LVKDPAFFEREKIEISKEFLVVFDEIHKFSRWKNYLKGTFDQFHEDFSFLVTGSGRLDIFKRGGDSLLGRYFQLPLFPLTLGELKGRMPSWEEFARHCQDPHAVENGDEYAALFAFGGFPEPLQRGSRTFYRRWFEERKKLVIREDIRDATNIREISLVETLSHFIPGKIGSPFSLNSLREDLKVAHDTLKEWVITLEQFYYLFHITPMSKSIKRALRKEPKVYLYDIGEINDEGARFENFVALHLHKAVSLWSALGEGPVSLHYVRDLEKREVDFVLLKDRKPFCLIECKLSDITPSPVLHYFQDSLQIPLAFQLVHTPGVCFRRKTASGALWVLSANRFLAALP